MQLWRTGCALLLHGTRRAERAVSAALRSVREFGMSSAHSINARTHCAQINCKEMTRLEFRVALDGLLADTTFENAFGLLIDLGGGTVIDASQALAVADAFARDAERFQGPIALHASGDDDWMGATLIAMVGRHHGFQMRSFREDAAAALWLTERLVSRTRAARAEHSPLPSPL
jgi:hypothetical protein